MDGSSQDRQRRAASLSLQDKVKALNEVARYDRGSALEKFIVLDAQRVRQRQPFDAYNGAVEELRSALLSDECLASRLREHAIGQLAWQLSDNGARLVRLPQEGTDRGRVDLMFMNPSERALEIVSLADALAVAAYLWHDKPLPCARPAFSGAGLHVQYQHRKKTRYLHLATLDFEGYTRGGDRMGDPELYEFGVLRFGSAQKLEPLLSAMEARGITWDFFFEGGWRDFLPRSFSESFTVDDLYRSSSIGGRLWSSLARGDPVVEILRERNLDAADQHELVVKKVIPQGPRYKIEFEVNEQFFYADGVIGVGLSGGSYLDRVSIERSAFEARGRRELPEPFNTQSKNGWEVVIHPDRVDQGYSNRIRLAIFEPIGGVVGAVLTEGRYGSERAPSLLGPMGISCEPLGSQEIYLQFSEDPALVKRIADDFIGYHVSLGK